MQCAIFFALRYCLPEKLEKKFNKSTLNQFFWRNLLSLFVVLSKYYLVVVMINLVVEISETVFLKLLIFSSFRPFKFSPFRI